MILQGKSYNVGLFCKINNNLHNMETLPPKERWEKCTKKQEKILQISKIRLLQENTLEKLFRKV